MVMTTYQEGGQAFIPGHDEAINPLDKARAAELYATATGTTLEAEYLRVSKAHPQKNGGGAMYRAFLREIESLFVVTARPVIAPFEPQRLSVAAEPLADEDRKAEEDEVRGDADTNALDTGTEGTGQAHAPDPDEPVDGGLISQLAAMIGEAGVITLTMMKIGREVTLGFTPQASGTETAVPVIVTGTPAFFDDHLIAALQPYVAARLSAVKAFEQAASAQRKAVDSARKKAETVKAAPQKTETKAAQKKPAAPKADTLPAPAGPAPTLHTLNLSAAPDTMLSATVEGQNVAVTAGDNALVPSTVLLTATHPLLGTHSKTLMLSSDRAYDFSAQQGSALRVSVSPADAAVTASLGQVNVAVDGECVLPEGQWTITAEADGHETQSVKRTFKPGASATTVTFTLELRENESLF
ncbi:hypothetical protein BOO71_0012028 [Deinococcus marmoris]|uniref:Uncharacterized protein n=2 Tax=Deinococcus marmoris TaxID=249408 RepID=A0A1U7NTX0_9DEIO|nr:hypothetical protein BOO71_0012028 [Deinococcus marmoris]